MVRDTPPEYFQPRRARFTVPYQHRDAEQEAGAVLAGGEPLLLVGGAMAGKSRLGEYLIRELYPDRPLWTPHPRQLPSFLAAGVPERAVMWLDELHEFLNVDGLRTDWVTVLTRRGAVVVATMPGVERARFTPSGEVRHPQFAAVERFSAVQVLGDDPTENARLARALETPEQRASIQQVGLGAFLGGGPIAQARLQDNRDTHPLGCAMVQAAADWRRIGLSNIPQSTLEMLAPHYLPAAHRHHRGETHEDARGWATERVDQVVQLLEVTGTDTLRCSDYIVDHLTPTTAGPGEIRPIPDVTWQAGAAHPSAGAVELLTFGVSAYRVQRPDIAIAAFRRGADSGHRDAAATALVNLGVLEEEQGNLGAVRAAYQQALATGHPDAAPTAAITLGYLEQEHGNLGAARAAYQQAITTGHPSQAPTALVNLGNLEREHGNLEAARAAYQQAITTGHPSQAPTALVNLGILEEERGNLGAARAAYQQALITGHPDVVPQAAFNLGYLERGQGNVDAARAAYQQALNTGHPDVAPQAAIDLKRLEEGPH